jgi:hypothetical protein
LNSIHPYIRFITETEEDNSLPFCDVLAKRKPAGLLGHVVYRKPIHTDLYSMTAPTTTHQKHMLFLNLSNKPVIFMNLKALMMKYNISRRFSDKIARAQWTSTKPSTPNRGHIHSGRS